MVEAQHKVSTRQLVDSLEEQAVLEEIIEEVKPPKVQGREFDELHSLLYTPFRHPPLKHGSRFGRATERGIWYGSITVETSLAEKAYYLLVLLAGTSADLRGMSCDWSAFEAGIDSDVAVDLTQDHFAAHHEEIFSPSSYAASQALGAAMRADGIEAFLFRSARCPQRGLAMGVFSPKAFSHLEPRSGLNAWKCNVTEDGCEVVRLNLFTEEVLVFKRAGFERDGVLPAPCLQPW